MPLPVSVPTQAASRLAQSSSQLPPDSGVSAEKQERRAVPAATDGGLSAAVLSVGAAHAHNSAAIQRIGECIGDGRIISCRASKDCPVPICSQKPGLPA